jgi:hypothetical protein
VCRLNLWKKGSTYTRGSGVSWQGCWLNMRCPYDSSLTHTNLQAVKPSTCHQAQAVLFPAAHHHRSLFSRAASHPNFARESNGNVRYLYLERPIAHLALAPQRDYCTPRTVLCIRGCVVSSSSSAEAVLGAREVRDSWYERLLLLEQGGLRLG